EDKGHIQVKCEPGISIRLDGDLKGVSAAEYGGLMIRDVPAGVHELKALKEGFIPQVKLVTVEKDRVAVVELGAFIPKVGSIEIRTQPVECLITCPGIGVTNLKKADDPWRKSGVPVGKLNVTLMWTDKTLKLNIEVKEACRTEVMANFLKMEIGSVVVDPKAEEARKAAEAMRNAAKNAPFPLIAISPGTFLMGSDKGSDAEKPVHKVTLTKAFLMGATEVTQKQWTAVMGNNPSYWKGNDLPVACIDWNDAVEFCRKLTEAERKKGNLPAGMEYRLPTEAEWEYCCRAGSTTEFSFGDDVGLLGDYAWFDKNAKSTTHPVGSKKPNAWGLYDMHGNVLEWCYDWYAAKYQTGDQTDPVGPATGLLRVWRGGSWILNAGFCRSANRPWNKPGLIYFYGFRVVVSQMNEAEKREEAPKTEEERKKEAMRDQMNNAPFPLIAISPGTFMMGSEKGENDEMPVHKVTITKPFLMGETEVTQAQYRAVMNASPGNLKGDDLPVECVSWNGAVEFCRKLTEAEREKGNLPAGMEYRLPTEAEWEYCCRAGGTTEFSFGDDEGRLGDYAWLGRNSKCVTHPVGTKKPNSWGLYDMYGNVYEWCLDWYGPYPSKAGDQTDPVGPATGDSRVMRGGSWECRPCGCRSAFRDWCSPDRRTLIHNLGFRIVVGAPLTQK
ncbi:MAG: SUMF1/EgtB/PvdO family nonheme iron enzyme, partial [Candidatus Brocadiia bacterium]